MMLKSCTASPSNLSPTSYASSKTSRPVSQYQSVQSLYRREQSQNQLITCLMQELKEAKMRQTNLKRINNTLVKALEGEKKQSNPNNCQQIPLSDLQLEQVTEEKLYQQQRLNNYLKKKLSDLQKSSKSMSINSSQKSISSQCSSKSRQQSLQKMQHLIDGMVKSKCSLAQNLGNQTILTDKTNIINKKSGELANSNRKPEDPTVNINSLVTNIANQKIELQLRVRSIQDQLCNRDLTRKQRQLLENSLRNLRRTSKSDQYQEYLKDKILKEIDRYSTRAVMKMRKQI